MKKVLAIMMALIVYLERRVRGLVTIEPACEKDRSASTDEGGIVPFECLKAPQKGHHSSQKQQFDLKLYHSYSLTEFSSCCPMPL